MLRMPPSGGCAVSVYSKMSYTNKELLCSLIEVRDRAIKDLEYLLKADHVPDDINNLISKERQVISDLNSLIYEEHVKLARKELEIQIAFVQTPEWRNVMERCMSASRWR